MFPSACGAAAAPDAVPDAVAATANGDDTYNFAIADDGSTTADVNNITRVYSTRTYTGSLETANPATRVLGSAIPVATSGTDTLLFPGGALAGFEVNDIVLLTTDGGVKAYLVAAVSAGAAPVHSNPGNTAHSDLEGFSTAEVQGSLQLKAYADQTVSLNGANVTFGGGNAAPAFATVGSIPDLSVPVSEMVLVQVDITASASVAGTDGNVGYTLTTTDSDTANPATISCTVGVFDSVDLSIQKDVRNFTDSGAFAATASGNPGDTLEYRVTITNNGGDAADVTVTDAVPAYTSLVTHSVAYGDGLGGNIFATINDGTSTVVLTNSNADSETQPGAPTETGYGNNAGTTAGSAITFYVGDTSDNASGGIVTSSDTFTIIYQVQID